ncbi:MAG: ATP-binding cassette domain-containing protein [Cyclobacteriaceae bacterium]
MLFVWKYLKVYYRNLLSSTILSVASGLGLILIIRTLHKAVTDGIPDPLIFWLSFIGGLFAYVVIGIYAEKMLSIISNRIVLEMRMDLLRKVFKTDYEKIEGRKKELFTVTVTDVNALSRIIDRIPMVVKNTVISIGGTLYLISISWVLCLFLIALIFLMYAIIRLRNKKAYNLLLASRRGWDGVYHSIHDIIYGIKELTLSSSLKTSFIERYLFKAAMNERDKKIAQRVHGNVTNRSSETLLLIGIGGAIAAMQQFDLISIAVFAQFITISLFVLAPLTSLAGFGKDFLQLKAITDHIAQVGLDLKESDENQVESTGLSTKQILQLKSIEYHYPDGDANFKLGALDITIPFNKTTLICGSNGSGKTTLAKVITGLYTPTNGVISYGDKSINTESVQAYRDKISAVFTDNHLFKNREMLNADISRANELLEIFHLNKKVSFVDGHFQESGLSTGQQKRLALIISILEDKEIYVFDEWAANQDPEFKKAFYYKLIPNLKSMGKTIVLITHDDQYFDIADQLYIMRDGRLI